MPELQLKVEYNYHCGDDLSCVNAARRSFGKKSEWDIERWDYYYDVEMETKVPYPIYKLKEKDVNLLRFLARGMSTDDFEEFCAKICITGEKSLLANEACDYNLENHFDQQIKESLWQWRNTPTHSTPFNHCFISFDVAAPIFVARQLVKHEYLIMSEFSRRYKTEDIEFYEPDYWRKAPPDKKQGSLDEPVTGGITGKPWGEGYHKTVCETSVVCYSDMLEMGVAPEQARMVLPQSLMTSWTWSGTLGAFAKMCRERLDPHAQYETRLVAQQVYEYLKQHYPVSAPLLVEGVK